MKNFSELKPIEESNVTFKIGLVILFIFILIVFIFGALWNYNQRIIKIETNYENITTTLNKIDKNVDTLRIDRYET
jgi:hypothetical protein